MLNKSFFCKNILVIKAINILNKDPINGIF